MRLHNKKWYRDFYPSTDKIRINKGPIKESVMLNGYGAALPKASVFWVNYNSMHAIEIITKSLNAIAQLDYPDFELIIVDNDSTDGSGEAIKKHAKSKLRSSLKVKLIKLSRNWGFAGGVNFAYRARDRGSKYVAVVNNDAIPKPDYLKKLATFLEEHEDIGAVQGIVARLGEDSVIDSGGLFVNEGLYIFSPFKGKPVHSLRNPLYVSYVEGTMPVYREEAVRRVMGDSDAMYVTSGFMYYLEDVFLSLMLWSHDYKCMVLPVVTAEHFRMASTKKFSEPTRLTYYWLRNHVALLCMTNSRDKERIILKHIRRLALRRGGLATRGMVLKSLMDGIRLGGKLREKYGTINLYKAPILRTPVKKRLII